MPAQYGAAWPLLEAIKRAIDPHGIMNPGKVGFERRERVVSGERAVHARRPTTDSCRYCWMCRHVCPVGFVTKRETHTPHAWALLIASVTRGVSAWNADTVDALYHCADCGCCESHCATTSRCPRRSSARAPAWPPPAWRPAAAVDVQARLERWGSIHGDPGPRPAQATGPVGLFVGDAVPAGETRGVDAALRLLARAGLDAVVVGAGRSTGLVASALGFVDTAKTLAAAVLADVAASGCRQLLVLGPGDRFAFERAYASRLGVTWPEGVRVREVDGRAGRGARQRHAARSSRRRTAVPWAYQEPDHAVRVGDRPWPRQLLAAALGAGHERRPAAPGRAGASVRHRRRARPDPAGARRRAGRRAHRGRPIRGRGPAGHRGSGLRPASCGSTPPDALEVVDLFELLASRLLSGRATTAAAP